jgi:hypothetical protein
VRLFRRVGGFGCFAARVHEDVAVEFVVDGCSDDFVVTVRVVDQRRGDCAVGDAFPFNFVAILQDTPVRGLARCWQTVNKQCVVAAAQVEVCGDLAARGGGEPPGVVGGDWHGEEEKDGGEDFVIAGEGFQAWEWVELGAHSDGTRVAGFLAG